MIARQFLYYAVICAFLLLSCSSKNGEEIQTAQEQEHGAAKTRPEGKALLHDADYSIKIEPQEGFRNTVFRLASQNFALTDARIQWMVSGVPVEGAENISFALQDAGHGKGDTVQAKAIIDSKEVLSNTVKIKNSPPEFTKIKLMPEIFKPGDTLFVEADANDIDGDEVIISYEWKKNGEPAGEGMRINTPLKRGDRVSIEATPFDSEEHGIKVLLDKKIENLPPVIIEDAGFNFDGNIYTHRVRADDPDGDTLTYSLKSGKDNIKIDPETGLIIWDVPMGFTGSSTITVSVTDGQGGESMRELTFEIKPVSSKGKR